MLKGKSMIRFVFIFLFLISVAKAEDNCVYQTQQVIENGKVISEKIIKSCTETETLNKQNFLVTWLTDERYQNSVIIVFMGILENAKGVREELSQAYIEAQNTMNMARAMEGDIAVRGAAEALKEHPEIDVESKNIISQSCSI